GLPHRLEHFVGGESVSFVEQFLGLGQPFVRGELGVVGNSFDLTDASVRQGSTITIPRPLVLRAAALVTIPVTVSGLRPHSCLTTSSPRPPKAWHRRSRATSLRVAPRPRWVAPRAGSGRPLRCGVVCVGPGAGVVRQRPTSVDRPDRRPRGFEAPGCVSACAYVTCIEPRPDATGSGRSTGGIPKSSATPSGWQRPVDSVF